MLRKNITNGNFCRKNHYVDVVDLKILLNSAMTRPPGKNSWYVEGPTPVLKEKIGNYEMDQLIQCLGWRHGFSRTLKTLDPNFDERGATGVPTWKKKSNKLQI